MRQSTAWLIQAKSDMKAALKLAGDRTQPEAYCQVAAKAQQTVEKSIKALQCALYHAGLYGSAVGSAHPVSNVASAIRTAAPNWPKELRENRKKVLTILSDARLKTIKLLDSIVPQYPAHGQLPRRNTEYPFQDTPGLDTWKAPAEKGVFTRSEIDRFLRCAQAIQDMTSKIVTALELAYP
ncbi:hypothetical protein WMF31_03120 [Sorangium sp. So ce1036]|uniref:hypothetical protein n=1 Tax=Sorangium sp. So ce1036 TaxID=3133328 RepID=UPI003F10FA26